MKYLNLKEKSALLKEQSKILKERSALLKVSTIVFTTGFILTSLQLTACNYKIEYDNTDKNISTIENTTEPNYKADEFNFENLTYYIDNCEENLQLIDISYEYNSPIEDTNRLKEDIDVSINQAYRIYDNKLQAEFYRLESKEEAVKYYKFIIDKISNISDKQLSSHVNRKYIAAYNTDTKNNRAIIQYENYVITMLGDKEAVKNLLDNFGICPY